MTGEQEPLKDEQPEEKFLSGETQYEGLADDIIGVSEYAPEKPSRKKFLPWHKPRKQFVREEQWCEEILNLVDEMLPENNILKYLGLPGDDLLDIRYFHNKICLTRNLQLRFLGFNNSVNAISTNKTEFNISLDEVSKLDLIDPSSNVIGDDICKIADIDSVAWEKSRKMGPFDVINIDLCDGFGKHPPDEFLQTHYNTLAQLLTLQARRPNPWLLFLTTRCGSVHIHGKVQTQLRELYGKNLDSCQGFKKASLAKFSIEEKEDFDTLPINEQLISDVFIVSLVKWIAHILVNQNPPSKLEVRSIIGYKVYPKANHQDLVSIAIKIVPTFLSGDDGIGLVKNHKENSKPDECVMALQALESISNQVNADEKISGDKDLNLRLITSSSELLDYARYDVSEYEKWVLEL